MNKKIAEVLAKTVQFICRVNAPYSIKTMSEERCLEIMEHAQAGDVILIRTLGELTTLFTPSKWTHSMLVLNSDIVFEAKITGTRLTHAMYALARCDQAILLRPRFLVNTDTLEKYAISLYHKPYDFKFEETDESLYCHEACAKVLEHSSGIVVPKVMSKLGMKWLPESFTDSNLFERVV